MNKTETQNAENMKRDLLRLRTSKKWFDYLMKNKVDFDLKPVVPFYVKRLTECDENESLTELSLLVL